LPDYDASNFKIEDRGIGIVNNRYNNEEEIKLKKQTSSSNNSSNKFIL